MSRADTAPDHHSFWHDAALPFIEARAVQDGRRVCYDKHSHPHFSIGAITGGHSHYLNQRSRQEVGRGHLVLMNPEEVHACNPVADEPWSYLMFYFDTGWLQRQQEEAGLGHEFRPFDMTASRDPLLYQGLCRLHRQLWQEPEPLAREVACHQFSRQLLARLTPASWDDRPPQRSSSAAAGHCSRVAPSPNPISNNSRINPKVAPTTWRRLAAKPCLAPLPRATRLTGPGVMDMARANPAMDNSRLVSMNNARIGKRSPQPSRHPAPGIEGNCDRPRQ